MNEASGGVQTDDPFTRTVQNRLPGAVGVFSGLLVIPVGQLALLSPMAMDGGQSALGWALVGYLTLLPFLLATAAVAGILCYRRFTRARFLVATAPLAFTLALVGLLRTTS